MRANAIVGVLRAVRAGAALWLTTLACAGRALARSTGEGAVDLDALPDFGAQLVKMLLVLAALLALLIVLAKLLPRWIAPKGPKGADGLLEIVERRAVDAKKSLLLVRVAGRFYLVGSSDAGLQPLSGGELDQAALRALVDASGEGQGEGQGASFAERLAEGRPSQARAEERLESV